MPDSVSSVGRSDFSQRLREWRRRRALSQRELAALAGVQQVTIARLEIGSQQPRPRTIRKLAKALQVTIDDLQGLP
jgi:transcriptional regulator with XRE-family HTH domain